jgi:hypothetical protein
MVQATFWQKNRLVVALGRPADALQFFGQGIRAQIRGGTLMALQLLRPTRRWRLSRHPITRTMAESSADRESQRPLPFPRWLHPLA